MACDDLLDEFEAALTRRRPDLTAPPDADGYRRVTAAILLFRGVELLEAARACRGQVLAPAAELVLRTTTEVALRGRFLLGPDGEDEFGRMTAEFLHRGEQQAAALETHFGGAAPSFLAAVVQAPAGGKTRTRDLHCIAVALDKERGLNEDDAASSVGVYRTLYSAVSESAAHSGLAALRRFSETRAGRAAVVIAPEPLTNDRKLYLIVAGLLGELAREVFLAFGIPTAELDALGVRWPGR